MPHIIREHHINDICGKCKQPYGDGKVTKIIFHHHKSYESISCPHCGYETVKQKEDSVINDRYNFM